ncbi:MAG: ABC transporter ATP-binding protein [Methanobacteriota archaeon]
MIVREVSKSFGEKGKQTPALDGVNLEFTDSEFLGILGPNACGKSTLLRIIAGVEEPTSGSVEFIGFSTPRPVTPLIFQSNTLLPWRVLERNVGLVPELRNKPMSLRERVTKYFIGRTRLKGLEPKYPSELSGGYKRLTEIARALAAEEKMLLMDEPFRSLDALTRSLMQEEVLRVKDETKKGIVFVTHDIKEAVLLCDRVAVMTARPGRIKGIVKVYVPKPRSLGSMTHPNFSRAAKKIWGMLREEAEKSFAEVSEDERGKNLKNY